MRKFVLLVLPVIVIITCSALLSCNKPVEYSLGEEFTLSVGQSATIKDDGFYLEFKEVKEDSRCPSDVTCIWEGRITCAVTVTIAHYTSGLELVQAGLTEEYTTKEHEGYRISYKVTPYPRSGQQITRDMYRLHLVISRLPVLSDVIASILAEPSKYAEAGVVIRGYYRGWDLLHEANITPPVTRSDWVIKDSTEAIYVSAGVDSKVPENLNPGSIGDTQTALEVTGIVHINSEGLPYIQATKLSVIDY
jgi:hypothetical protein